MFIHVLVYVIMIVLLLTASVLMVIGLKRDDEQMTFVSVLLIVLDLMLSMLRLEGRI